MDVVLLKEGSVVVFGLKVGHDQPDGRVGRGFFVVVVVVEDRVVLRGVDVLTVGQTVVGFGL